MFVSALYTKEQGPPALVLVVHISIVIFPLRGQVSTELLPTVTDTLLFPEERKNKKGM